MSSKPLELDAVSIRAYTEGVMTFTTVHMYMQNEFMSTVKDVALLDKSLFSLDMA